VVSDCGAAAQLNKELNSTMAESNHKSHVAAQDAGESPLPKDLRNEQFPDNSNLHAPNLSAAKLARSAPILEQHISVAAEAAHMGFWFRDFDRDDFWASAEWRALFGFTSSETLHVEKFFQRLHPNDRETTRQALEAAYQGDGSYQTEHSVLLPDGQVRWISCQGRLELREDDQPLRLLGVSLDITRRKQAELEARAHRNAAAHLLRVASLGELSTSMAHELRQPLTAILSSAQAAQLLLARDDFDLQEIRDILGEIVAADKRAGAVIERLHLLVKRADPQPQQLEANQLIRDVLQLMNHELTGRSVQIVTDLAAGPLPVHGDRVQLQQVLLNLILNAVDAMSQPINGDRILTLQSRRLADYVIQISVTDTGQGIPPGGEEAIFEPYYTTKPEGLGLGLSLSRSILAAHHGRLRAESHGSKGATFHCIIPEWRDSPADARPQIS
jgi:two-component system, LuxR family, sensor kinase FixL